MSQRPGRHQRRRHKYVSPFGTQGPSPADIRPPTWGCPPGNVRHLPPHHLQILMERTVYGCHHLGREKVCTASGPKYTTMSRYLHRIYQCPLAGLAISTWTWWGPSPHQKVLPICPLSWTECPAGRKLYPLPPPQHLTAQMLCFRDG
jgi:hypothetical protein